MVKEYAPNVKAIEIGIHGLLMECVTEQEREELQYGEVGVILKATEVNAYKKPQEF